MHSIVDADVRDLSESVAYAPWGYDGKLGIVLNGYL